MLIRDKKGNLQKVPCGKCGHCLMNRRSSWTLRCFNELKTCDKSYFITITYDDDHLPLNDVGIPILKKSDFQLFMKRLRKFIYPIKVKYYGVGEYGGKFERPHYHFILFNFGSDKRFLEECLDKTWNKGIYYVGDVSQASIHYVTGYFSKTSPISVSERPFSLMSQGIGLDYVRTTQSFYLRNKLVSFAYLDGSRVPLPRYYKDKLFDDVTKRYRQRYFNKLNYEKELVEYHMDYKRDFESRLQCDSSQKKRLRK